MFLRYQSVKNIKGKQERLLKKTLAGLKDQN